ncbi:MAG: S1C family serine protease [Candidatus Thermochlorobacter sp.]
MKISPAILTILSVAIMLSACTIEEKERKSSGELTPAQKIESFASPNSLYAQSKSDDISNSRRNAITQAVAVASPSVVGINVTEVREYQVRDPFSFFFEDDPFFGPFMRRRNQTFKQEVKSLGSGFFISSDGYIVTNSHVAGNAVKIVVTTIDGKQHDARLVGADELTDVALLKVDDGGPFPALKLGNSDEVIVGEWVIAMGNPFGLFEINNKPIVTVGVVSSTGLNFPDVQGRSYRDMIQTDAAINSGNSGGPLLNADAEVIGVNTFIYTGGGAGSIGIGFAIPINRVKKIIEELKIKGKIERSFKTGISVQALTPQLARYFGVEQGRGVVVVNVEKGSTAERAGVKVGDVIIEADGQRVRNEQELMFAVRELRAGDILRLKVMRDKKLIDINVKLEK